MWGGNNDFKNTVINLINTSQLWWNKFLKDFFCYLGLLTLLRYKKEVWKAGKSLPQEECEQGKVSFGVINKVLCNCFNFFYIQTVWYKKSRVIKSDWAAGPLHWDSVTWGQSTLFLFSHLNGMLVPCTVIPPSAQKSCFEIVWNLCACKFSCLRLLHVILGFCAASKLYVFLTL